jgi:hypothetical protein
MRPLLIVLAGLCASAATSLVLYAAVQLEKKPYVEVLQGGLVRTDADDITLNASVAHVLGVNRSPAATPEVLKGDDMPTLVFVHHDDREVANRVARHLALELAENGVSLVN